MNNREKLQKQIDEISKLTGLEEKSPEFKSWDAKTERVLESIFGKDSSQKEDFHHIGYFPSVISYGTPDHVFQRAYLEGLHNAKLLLEGMLDEIDEEPQIAEILDINIDFWKLFNQDLIDVSKKLFEDGHHSNSVLEAMKLVENKVKDIVFKETGVEIYGTDLMNRAFSVDNPIVKLTKLKTISDKDIQRGYMDMFRGSILAIRNPKGHDNNIQLEKEKAIHLLFLANLLLMRLKEAGF